MNDFPIYLSQSSVFNVTSNAASMNDLFSNMTDIILNGMLPFFIGLMLVAFLIKLKNVVAYTKDDKVIVAPKNQLEPKDILGEIELNIKSHDDATDVLIKKEFEENVSSHQPDPAPNRMSLMKNEE